MLARASISNRNTEKESGRRIYSLLQRACAASLAMRDRLRADKLSARALPPLEAPSLESATAAGFFFLSGGRDMTTE
jgi:hypothetical protein